LLKLLSFIEKNNLKKREYLLYNLIHSTNCFFLNTIIFKILFSPSNILNFIFIRLVFKLKSKYFKLLNPSNAPFSISLILLIDKFNFFKLFNPLNAPGIIFVILHEFKSKYSKLFNLSNNLFSIILILLLDKSNFFKLFNPLNAPFSI